MMYVSVVLFTNRKSHKDFRLVLKVMTLIDLEPHRGRYFASLRPKRQLSEPTALNELKIGP